MRFEEEITAEFVRVASGEQELALEEVESWFWSDEECDSALIESSVGVGA